MGAVRLRAAPILDSKKSDRHKNDHGKKQANARQREKKPVRLRCSRGSLRRKKTKLVHFSGSHLAEARLSGGGTTKKSRSQAARWSERCMPAEHSESARHTFRRWGCSDS